jgi:hypothetical protein
MEGIGRGRHVPGGAVENNEKQSGLGSNRIFPAVKTAEFFR